MPSEGEWTEVRVEEPTGSRLDSYLAERLSLSRSRVTQLIEGGHVLLNGAAPKKRSIPEVGDVLRVRIPPPEPSEDIFPPTVDAADGPVPRRESLTEPVP